MTFGILALRIWSLCRFWVPAIFMHSLGDVWHLGSEDLESLSGSLLCRIWRIWSLWGPVSLAALFLPIFMHSFGDVWHLGSEDLESLQVLGPCYLYAFLR